MLVAMSLTIENPNLGKRLEALLAEGYTPEQIVKAGVDSLKPNESNEKCRTLTGLTWAEFFASVEPLPKKFFY